MHMEALLEVLPEQLHPKIKNLIEACGTKSEYFDKRLLPIYSDTDFLLQRASMDATLHFSL